MPLKAARLLPHGFVEKRTPDGRSYWIDYRPSPPSWLLPSDVSCVSPKPSVRGELDSISTGDIKTSPVVENIALPKGVEKHHTPSGPAYYVDTRPRVSWIDPRTVDFNIDRERLDYVNTCSLLLTDAEPSG